jgi:hypothetical protein
VEASRPTPKTRVFMSYSRKDQPFVRRLAASLDEREFISDWDQATTDPGNVSTGISAEDQWWARLQEMISAADVVVFVISPNSAGSSVCDEEIAYAHALGKRVIAILYRSIDFKAAPPRLSALNVRISFVEDSTVYEESLEDLATALALDVAWLRESTRLTLAATRWNAADKENDRLLQGVDVRDAERWAARRPASAPPVSELVLEFIEASREADEQRRAVSECQRLRYQEIDRITRTFLEEELKVREARPVSKHPGVADENEVEKELIRSMIGLQKRWHPQRARHVTGTNAMHGYAEIFLFPCCGRHVKDFLATSDEDPPSQFRADGCEEIPESIQYDSPRRANPFSSSLISDYRRLRPSGEPIPDSTGS